MIGYLIGVVTEINLDSIILEVNQVGYLVNFLQTPNFKLNDTIKIYTYQVVREDEISLYGFLNKSDRFLFLKLINVKGIGPKTALNMFTNTASNDIIAAIEKADIAFLKTLPGIGAKSAQQIILDLQGKLVLSENKVVSENYQASLTALKNLGYKASEIKSIEAELRSETDLSLEEYVKLGLQLLLKRQGG